MKKPNAFTFAYGMNMAPSTMGDARLGRAGVLHGWKLEYRQYADIVPAEGCSVPGVLWPINANALADLDMREGYPDLYDRTWVDVEIADGVMRAVVYFMAAGARANYVAMGITGISALYRDMLIEGRQAFGHPTDDIPAADPPVDRRAYLAALRAGPSWSR